MDKVFGVTITEDISLTRSYYDLLDPEDYLDYDTIEEVEEAIESEYWSDVEDLPDGYYIQDIDVTVSIPQEFIDKWEVLKEEEED